MKEDLIKALDKYKEGQPIKVINSGGASTLGMLGIALVVLKCLGYINISWLWVLAPFWIPLAITLAVVAILLLIIAIAAFNTKSIIESDCPSVNTKDVEIPAESKPEVKPKKKSRKKVKKDSNGEERTNQ